MALPAVDSFIGGLATLADPPWTQVSANGLVRDGSGGCDVSASGDDEIAVWNADTFADDQYAEGTVTTSITSADGVFIGLVVRSDGAAFASGNWYWAYTDAGGVTQIAKVVAGVVTVLATASIGGLVNGDVLRFDAVGTALTFSINGIPVVTASDSDLTSGAPGLHLSVGSGPGVEQFASFTGDDFSTPPPPGTHVVSGRGQFSVTGPLWISTAIAGRPAHIGNGVAEPTNWIHVGSLSWGTANGAMARYIVTRDLDLVALPTDMDTLWYEFASGITATIVELAAP